MKPSSCNHFKSMVPGNNHNHLVSHTYIYIDDVLSFNNAKCSDYIYFILLANYLDQHNKLSTRL